jgi:OFA family oxalate/formate antiporter-like MFS transporter
MTQRPWAAIAATTILILPLGSIYAFSVFLKPLEGLLGASRSELATVFGIAAIFYTVGMNVGPKLFGGLGIASFLALCALTGAGGIALSAGARSFIELAIGYGGLFGLGGGLAYVAAQQAMNLMPFRRSGLVNGYIVALLPCGAMLTAPACAYAIERFGVRETLWGLAAVLLATGLAAALMAVFAGMRLRAAGPAAMSPGERPGRADLFWKLFIVFLLAAAAGLMVLSQAAGIVAAYGGATALATLAATGVSGAIALARLFGGYLIDSFAIPKVMAGAQMTALAGGIALTLWPAPETSIAALLAIGMGYGIISGATAAAIAAYWRRALFGRVAGRVYIAWCLAALTLPVLAARLFDLTGGYRTAFVLAGACNLAAAMVALTLPPQSRTP